MNKNEIEALLASSTARHYVYHLLRPDTTPFYVGKGQNRRIFDHEREAKGVGRNYKLNTIRQITALGHSLRYTIVAFYDSEEECLAHEVSDIKRIGRHDLKTGPLTNLTDGGEGTSGMYHLYGPDAPGERGIANRFFEKLCKETRSVPVRPMSEFEPIALAPHRKAKTPSKRMAAALAASAIANRVLIEPGCEVPRRMLVEGTVMLIENGCGASILESGMATLLPGLSAGNEIFVLHQYGVDQLIALSNKDLLLDAGVLMP